MPRGTDVNREEVLPLLQQGLADVVLLIDDSGVVLWAGGDAASTIGVEPQALVGHPAAVVLAGPDETREWLGPVTTTGGVAGTRHALLRHENGTQRACEIRVRVASAGVRAATIRLLSRETHEPQSGKPRLTGHDTIHEINNLLGIVIGFTDVLLATVPQQDESTADLLEIRTAASAALERLRSG